MNKIPPKLKTSLNDDPEYKYCCVTGHYGTRNDPIEWHHNLIFGGKQVQEKFCILPLKYSLHKKANDSAFKERLDWIMLNRATDEELIAYSKAVDYRRMRIYLNEKFGPYTPVKPMKVSEPVDTKKGKPHWYPLSDQEWSIILKACKHHNDHSDVTYTPHALIRELILKHGAEIEEEATAGKVY